MGDGAGGEGFSSTKNIFSGFIKFLGNDLADFREMRTIVLALIEAVSYQINDGFR